MKPSHLEQTGEAGSDLLRDRSDVSEPLGMAFAVVICFGVSCAAAYVVMGKDWGLLAKLCAGTNGVFFAVTGLAALANALRDVASRFTAKSHAGISADSEDGRSTG